LVRENFVSVCPLHNRREKFQEMFNLLHGKSENHRGSACAKAAA